MKYNSRASISLGSHIGDNLNSKFAINNVTISHLGLMKMAITMYFVYIFELSHKSLVYFGRKCAWSSHTFHETIARCSHNEIAAKYFNI